MPPASVGLLRHGRVLRPGLTDVTPGDLGFRLARSRGIDCWLSVEDSMVLLGPARAGKGRHTVVPAVLDAPGPTLAAAARPWWTVICRRAPGCLGSGGCGPGSG